MINMKKDLNHSSKKNNSKKILPNEQKNAKSKKPFKRKNKFLKSQEEIEQIDRQIKSDPRFSHIARDPRYKEPPKEELKIKLDKRFKSVLTNKNFITKDVPDPRGRPRSFGTKETLDKFYELDSDEDEDQVEKEESSVSEEDVTENNVSEEDVDESDVSEEESEVSDEDKETETKSPEHEQKLHQEFLKCLVDPEKDLARGDLFYSEDSSDDDSTTTDEDVEDRFGEFDWGEWDRDAEWDADGKEVEETNRFAVCNMDWDRVKAVDLMVIFSSFVPASGKIEKVTIYPSEYGKERIDEEEKFGPQELVRLTVGNKKREDEDIDDLEKIKKGVYSDSSAPSAVQIEALRRYQRNRLKYYYAVVECDSTDTARAIYKECDQSLFDVVGVTMDLRYIPSEMEFDEVPFDECSKVPSTYLSEKAPTKALQEAKPTLTWDETDHKRKKVLSEAMNNVRSGKKIDEDLLKVYVGDSEDSDDVDIGSDDEDSDRPDDAVNTKDRIAKFRSLISEIDQKEKKTETFWDTNEDSGKEGELSDEDDVEEEDSDTEDVSDKLTPFEKYLEKRKEKRKERKTRLTKMGEKSETESEEQDSDSQVANDVSDQKDKKKKVKSSSKENEGQLSLLVMEEEEEDKKHFNLRKIRDENRRGKKQKKKTALSSSEGGTDLNDVENFEVNWNDPRFSALFTPGSFHVDPSHPKYDPSMSQGPAKSEGNPLKRPKIEKSSKVTDQNQLENDVSNLIHKIRMKTSKKRK